MNRSLLVFFIFLFPLYSFGQTFTVDDDGPADFNNIQDAIVAASNGYEIVIADGIYTGYGNRDIDFYGKAITVRSANGPQNCIIDCNASHFDFHRGFLFQSTEQGDSVLDGLTIVAGHIELGGGIYCQNSSPAIKNCIIKNNIACGSSYTGYGGGIYCDGGGPTISDCLIYENWVPEGGGGGIMLVDSAAVIVNCTIDENNSGWGGGIKTTGASPLIKNCIINNNFIWDWGGSGIESRRATIVDCIITGNATAMDGGAIWGGGTGYSPDISGCVISNNYASYMCGGGVYNCDARISNCVIENNKVWWGHSYESARGAGLYDCDGVITNCTIVGNCAYTSQVSPQSYGAGIYDCNGTISNCIIRGNRASLNPQVCSCCDPDYCCIQDWTDGGTANINTDPCFAVAGRWDDAGTPDDANDDFWVSGDYDLKSAFGRWDSVKQSWVYDDVTSPCIDTGDPNSDWTAEFWPHGRRINMGAYGGTVQASMSSSSLGNAADLNNDANVDMTDYSLMAAQWRTGQARTIPPANITVDGNLADWTSHIEWIPLDKIYFGQPSDISDAKFALRWNKQAGKIYAAVIVDDNDHVFTDEYISWDAGDRIEVYSQGDAEGGTGFWDPEHPNWDSAQQYMAAPDTAGASWATWGNGWSLGPDVGLEYAVVVDANRIIYEIAVKQFDNYGTFSSEPTVETDLHIGHIVGFDIIADTRWVGGFGMLSENLMMDKFKDADSFAKYVLTDRYPDSLYGPLIGDIDRNRVVDISDMYTMAENWLAQD